MAADQTWRRQAAQLVDKLDEALNSAAELLSKKISQDTI